MNDRQGPGPSLWILVAIGVAAGAAGTSAPRIELWNAGSAGRIFTREMPSPVRAVAISDDGKLACWSGGWRHEVFVEPISNLVADAKVRGRLGGVGRRIGRVAFERQEDGRAAPRRIARCSGLHGTALMRTLTSMLLTPWV
jgi:hypothetical protein